MGALSVRKSKVFERAVVELLRAVFPNVRRRAMQARGGHEGADLDGTPGWWFECSHGKAVSPIAKWEQAWRDLDSSTSEALEQGLLGMYDLETIPAAITKRDRGEVLATLALVDLVDLIEKAEKWEQSEAMRRAAERREPFEPDPRHVLVRSDKDGR